MNKLALDYLKPRRVRRVFKIGTIKTIHNRKNSIVYLPLIQS
jgi:hypothetical protein